MVSRRNFLRFLGIAVASFFMPKFAGSFSEYDLLKSKIAKELGYSAPTIFSEKVSGVKTRIDTSQKLIALTFDACGGKAGKCYNKNLIELLQKEMIPSTLFISGRWIDSNYSTLKELSEDQIFEIENHGAHHLPATISGKCAYGIRGPKNIYDLIDEIELNSKRIESITCKKPLFYRSGTAYYDDIAVKVANMLGYQVVNFDIVSGDAIQGAGAKDVSDTVLSKVRNGSIIIMHMNHPERCTYNVVKEIIPQLKDQGYSFTQLKNEILI